MSKEKAPYKLVIFRGNRTAGMTNFGDRDDILYIGDGHRHVNMSELTLSEKQIARIDQNTHVVAIFHGKIIQYDHGKEHVCTIEQQTKVDDFGTEFLCELILENLEQKKCSFHILSCFSGFIREELSQHIQSKIESFRELNLFLHATNRTISSSPLRKLVEIVDTQADTEKPSLISGAEIFLNIAYNCVSTSITLLSTPKTGSDLGSFELNMTNGEMISVLQAGASEDSGALKRLEDHIFSSKLKAIASIQKFLCTQLDKSNMYDLSSIDELATIYSEIDVLLDLTSHVAEKTILVDTDSKLALIDELVSLHSHNDISDVRLSSIIENLAPYQQCGDKIYICSTEEQTLFSHICKKISDASFWLTYISFNSICSAKSINVIHDRNEDIFARISEKNASKLFVLNNLEVLKEVISKTKLIDVDEYTLNRLFELDKGILLDYVPDIFTKVPARHRKKMENKDISYYLYDSNSEDATEEDSSIMLNGEDS